MLGKGRWCSERQPAAHAGARVWREAMLGAAATGLPRGAGRRAAVWEPSGGGAGGQNCERIRRDNRGGKRNGEEKESGKK